MALEPGEVTLDGGAAPSCVPRASVAHVTRHPCLGFQGVCISSLTEALGIVKPVSLQHVIE